MQISEFKNMRVYLGMVNFKTEDQKFLRILLIFNSNSTRTQEVWSLNQFFKREWKSVQPSHKYHFMFLQNFVCFSLYNWLCNWASLLGISNWALVCGLEWDQKETNKTLTPMSLGLFCQLLTSPKLPLIIFNNTI